MPPVAWTLSEFALGTRVSIEALSESSRPGGVAQIERVSARHGRHDQSFVVARDHLGSRLEAVPREPAHG